MSKPYVFLSKTDIARRHIQRMIISRQVRPGDRITTRGVSEALGISETPIREAIRSLASEGWLEVQTHIGAVVATAGREQLREIYALRALIGSLAIELGKSCFDAERLARIDANIEEATAAVEAQDTDRYTQTNHDFHVLLNDTPQSQWCLRMLVSLSVMTSAHYGFHLRPARMEASLSEHKAIRDALRAGDFDAAVSLIKLHENSAYEVLASELAEDLEVGAKSAV
jgi:DNA-binding GntR family transcriptional regulator